MKKAHESFETFLKGQDSRYTSQKRAIADKVFNTKVPFEVDLFIFDSTKDGDKFSRATVYRTIKQLYEAGLIQRIATDDGKVYYERNISEKQHDHLICNQCGKISPLKNTGIEETLEKFCNSIGFKPEYRSLHLYGVCKKCAARIDKEAL